VSGKANKEMEMAECRAVAARVASSTIGLAERLSG